MSRRRDKIHHDRDYGDIQEFPEAASYEATEKGEDSDLYGSPGEKILLSRIPRSVESTQLSSSQPNSSSIHHPHSYSTRPGQSHDNARMMERSMESSGPHHRGKSAKNRMMRTSGDLLATDESTNREFDDIRSNSRLRHSSMLSPNPKTMSPKEYPDDRTSRYNPFHRSDGENPMRRTSQKPTESNFYDGKVSIQEQVRCDRTQDRDHLDSKNKPTYRNRQSDIAKGKMSDNMEDRVSKRAPMSPPTLTTCGFVTQHAYHLAATSFPPTDTHSLPYRSKSVQNSAQNPANLTSEHRQGSQTAGCGVSTSQGPEWNLRKDVFSEHQPHDRGTERQTMRSSEVRLRDTRVNSSGIRFRQNPGVAPSVKTMDEVASIGDAPKDISIKNTDTDKPEFQVRKHANDFFQRGRVFQLPWFMPAGHSLSGKINQKYALSRVNRQPYHEKYQYMLVVRARYGYSICCPIYTHQGKGLSDKNIPLEEKLAHAIIYSWPGEIYEIEGETPRGFTKDAIPVIMVDGQPPLAKTSRVHFGQLQTVEWNTKVKSIGMVERGSRDKVRTYYVTEMGELAPPPRH